MQVTRIYTGDDNESHFEDIDIEFTNSGPGGSMSDPVQTRYVVFRETDGSYDLDFHTAPRRQYVVNLRGSVEIETGSGDKRLLRPGSILLAEDTTGRGHKSRAVGGEERESLFIALNNDE